eukprot:1623940-Rhodomonas_salina.1
MRSSLRCTGFGDAGFGRALGVGLRGAEVGGTRAFTGLKKANNDVGRAHSRLQDLCEILRSARWAHRGKGSSSLDAAR